MQAYESGDERGLIYGYVLNGRGGGRRVGRNQIAVLDLLPEESLWLHWDRGVPEAQAWLRDSAGSASSPAICCWRRRPAPVCSISGPKACWCSSVE